MKPVSFIILLVALLLGALATYFGRIIVAQNTVAPPAAVETKIVVAAVPMTFGTELTEANLAEIPWPAPVVPDGAFTSKQDILKEGRRVVLTPISKSEPVLTTKITGSGQRASLAALLDPGMRAVTIRVDDVRGVAGFVRPGDRVDIILTQSVNGNPVADVLLQNVKVLAIDQMAADKTEGATVARAVTAEVNTEQAQKLVLAQGIGNLSLMLRQPDVAQNSENRRVTAADLAGSTEPKPQEVSQIARLEAQIAEMKARADKSGDQERKEFLNRIAELESRMSAELSRVSQRPVEKAPETTAKISTGAVVRVTRGLKTEDYSVARE